LGVFVLGALDAPEQREIGSHLAECPHCQAELVELEGLPLLLDRIPVGDVVAEVQLAELELTGRRIRAPVTNQPVEQPSPRLLGRLLSGTAQADRPPARAAHRRAPRWWRERSVALAAGVLLVAAAVAGTVGAVTGRPQPRPSAGPATETVTTTNAGNKVTASAWITPAASGTAIRLHVAGVPPGQHCWLVAVDRSGRHQTVVSWQVTYQGDVNVTGFTAIRPADLAALRVVQEGNRTLASLPVS
jgi:hypothetical protein